MLLKNQKFFILSTYYAPLLQLLADAWHLVGDGNRNMGRRILAVGYSVTHVLQNPNASCIVVPVVFTWPSKSSFVNQP